MPRSAQASATENSVNPAAQPPRAPRFQTKILATIGPASDAPDTVRRLILAGVSAFRLNFSHGDFPSHEERIRTIREVAAALNRPIAILGDLQGPKIRVGTIPASIGTPHPSGGGAASVEPGTDVVFERHRREAAWKQLPTGVVELLLPCTYPRLIDEVQPGHRVLINDGAVRMLAVDPTEPDTLRCRVLTGGVISTGKGINLPQSDISAPALTERDLEYVAFAVAHDVDYLALSFVRKPEEVLELRARLDEMCERRARELDLADAPWIPIVSKVEKPQALDNLEGIIHASDAVMVARGDLGVEMDIALVPPAQKRIVQLCAQHGKPCIVATQMLESMIESATPTRAEASDVANAVFDGADALMLSAETATGKNPVLVVETMGRIIASAETIGSGSARAPQAPTRFVQHHKTTAALAHGAWQIVRDLDAACVACWSQQGGTARYLSQNDFAVPILAFSSSPRAARRMALYNGVIPVCCQPPGHGTLGEWYTSVDRLVREWDLARPGDHVVLLAGRPLGKAKATNTIAIHEVGQPIRIDPKP